MAMKKIIFLMLLITLIAMTGCIFEPREAEDPESDDGGTWITPGQPKDVLANLMSGLAAAANSNYERSLHEDFTFIPRPEDRSNLGDEVFDGWDKEVEMAFLTRLKGIYLGERLIQFGDENMVFEREDISVGRAEFEGDYVMTLDPGDGSDPEVYEGRAIFIIVEANQGWMLLSWEDIDVIGSNPTSGYIRGTLRGTE